MAAFFAAKFSPQPAFQPPAESAAVYSASWPDGIEGGQALTGTWTSFRVRVHVQIVLAAGSAETYLPPEFTADRVAFAVVDGESHGLTCVFAIIRKRWCRSCPRQADRCSASNAAQRRDVAWTSANRMRRPEKNLRFRLALRDTTYCSRSTL